MSYEFKKFWNKVILLMLKDLLPGRNVSSTLATSQKEEPLTFQIFWEGKLEDLCSLNCNSRSGNFVLQINPLLRDLSPSAAEYLRTGFSLLAACNILVLER